MKTIIRRTKALLSGVALPLLVFTVSLVISTADCAAGYALFDKTNDTIQVSGAVNLNNAATYEARVSFTSVDGGVIFRDLVSGAEDKAFDIYPTTSLYAYAYPVNVGAGISSATNALSPNQWYHLAYVYDGTEERLYINGSLVASRPASGAIANAGGTLFVGANPDPHYGPHPAFLGYIDTLRISDVARYAGTSFPAPTGDLSPDVNAILLFNFDEAAGSTTVTDLSGNGHTGTLGTGFPGATAPQLLPSGPLPVVTSFTPVRGPAGALVTFIGTNLDVVTNLQFSGSSAAFSAQSSTQLVAAVPNGAITGLITLIANDGTITTAGAFTVGSLGFLDFDDGINGAAVGGFYACSGVLFSNVVWTGNVDITGRSFAGSSGRFVIWGESSGPFPAANSALVAVFTSPVTNVSIVATDVGGAGARMEAYDQPSGGNLVGSDQFIGSGIGVQTYAVLNVTAPSIRLIKLFQPFRDGNDGVVWDNLAFSPDPAPPCLGISTAGSITLRTPLGSTNVIEWASDLGASNWQTLTNVVVYQSPFAVQDPQVGQHSQRFYRAVRFP